MFLDLKDINREIATNARAFATASDKELKSRIDGIAKDIIANENCKVILISGPSGSGKTTSAMLLQKSLESFGHKAHALSLDNYFHTMTAEEKQLFAQNKIDLESPNRVDIDFLNSQLDDIINFKEVNLPRFDFKENVRKASGKTLKLKEGELVILEGIHALNPDVITIPDKFDTRIYVSVRTRVKTEANGLIHPEYIRLLRRMLRDRVHRARSFASTAAIYKSVQRGENLYIMPYKPRANYDIDTFLPYEINVYKQLIYDGLCKEGVDTKMPKLISLLQNALPAPTDIVPKQSLIREFIGNGEFEY